MDDSREMDDMTPKESAELQRVYDVMVKAMEREMWQLARFMVTRRDEELLGPTEFTVREKVLRAGAQALEVTINDRKKGGTKATASPVPTAAKTHAS